MNVRSVSSKAQSFTAHARKVFFELGGKPTMKEMPRMYDASAMDTAGPLGLPLVTPDIYYSGRYSGLVLYLSRLLRPIWKRCLVQKV